MRESNVYGRVAKNDIKEQSLVKIKRWKKRQDALDGNFKIREKQFEQGVSS